MPVRSPYCYLQQGGLTTVSEFHNDIFLNLFFPNPSEVHFIEIRRHEESEELCLLWEGCRTVKLKRRDGTVSSPPETEARLSVP
jgi:hypothetical protein